MNDLANQLLKTAQRRTISADIEAKALGLPLREVQAAINTLLRRHLIYRSSRPMKNFFGSGFAGYRATGEEV